MKRILIALSFLVMISCKKGQDQPTPSSDFRPSIGFHAYNAALLETDSAFAIDLVLSKSVTETETVVVSVSTSSNTRSNDFNLSFSDPELIVELQPGKLIYSFTIDANEDNDTEVEEVIFDLSTGSENLSIGDIGRFSVKIYDQFEIGSTYRDCLPEYKNFAVGTWNLEFFPLEGDQTVEQVSEIINESQVDIWVLQEIDDFDSFSRLLTFTGNYFGFAYNVRYGLDKGFLFSRRTISRVDSVYALFTDNSSAFPRQVVMSEITLGNNQQLVIGNLHLKCCDDGYERRVSASSILKQYLDSQHSNSPLIIAGDYNDELRGNTPFENFLNDPENYAFVDLSIANRDASNWSYPGFPSHIDHILISDELFSNFLSSKTLLLETCVPEYSSMVSDHRPVISYYSF